ncbi:MAG TPA: ferrous iron transport protein A [Verrucomicrobiota bacterium]|jgi:ferrous iron transport protein A|nr:ferrous iron transport protein A [Verrucomicrobiota bacterium]
MKTKTLKDVPVGEKATVVKINGTGILRRRIMDMGITRGISLYVHKVAPLGDPIQISLRGYELSLRKSEAEHIIVK